MKRHWRLLKMANDSWRNKTYEGQIPDSAYVIEILYEISEHIKLLNENIIQLKDEIRFSAQELRR
jgi:hypothetical protein